MSGSQIADLIVGNMKRIDWDNNHHTKYRLLAMQATANGIHKYITDNWKIKAVTVGTVNPKGKPFTEELIVDMVIAQPNILTNNLMTMTSMARNLTPLFNAIFTWLSSPPWQIILKSGKKLKPVGVGVVTFPTMVAMGASCLSEMMASKPTKMEDSWIIMGKHIYNGLMGNVIAPIPTTGACSSPSGAYTGITTCVLTF